MTLDSYTNLKAAVADHTNRSDLTTQIIDFITIAEARMNRELRIQAMETLGTLTTVAGTATIALPTRYREARWLYVDGDPKAALSYMPGEQLFITYAGSTQKKPAVFTRQGSTFRLGPTPDAVYTIYCLYFQAFQNLSGSVATNGLLDLAPDLYLYATLAAAELYIPNNRWQAYEAKYQELKMAVMAEDKSQRYSGSVKQVRSGTGNP